MQSSYGLARAVLRMFTVMGWLMIVGAFAALLLTWGADANSAVLSMALVLLVYGVVITFISEMAAAQIRTAENTAILMQNMQSLLEKVSTQTKLKPEEIAEFLEASER